MSEYVSQFQDKDRASLLIVDGNVRPGILVLVNDTDYEITGGVSCLISCHGIKIRLGARSSKTTLM